MIRGLRVTPRATREIRIASAWWDANRPAAPDAFRDAIERGFALIVTQPGAGELATNTRLPRVRRLHLDRVRYHLYYREIARERVVEVLALWHTSRLPLPRL